MRHASGFDGISHKYINRIELDYLNCDNILYLGILYLFIYKISIFYIYLYFTYIYILNYI